MDDDYNDKKDSNDNLEDIFGSFLNNSDLTKKDRPKENTTETFYKNENSLEPKEQVNNNENKEEKEYNWHYRLGKKSVKNNEENCDAKEGGNEDYARVKSKSDSDFGSTQPDNDFSNNPNQAFSSQKENTAENRIAKENRGHKNVHQGEITKNQITHVFFEGFTGRFFADIDGAVFDKYTTNVDITVRSIHAQEMSNKEKLVSAIIDDFDGLETVECEKIMRFKALNNEEESVIYDVEQFFIENNINYDCEEDEITMQYRKQNAINNKRREILKHAIETRMMYHSCLSAIKLMDDNIFKLYLKRLRNKKKYKYEDFATDLLALSNRKKELIEELKKYFVYKDYMYETTRLFYDDNVNSKSFDYKITKYFI